MYESKDNDLDIPFNKNLFFSQLTNSISDNYDIIKQISKGENEKIYEVKNIKTGKLFICKKISKLNNKKKEKLLKEINILNIIDHPNIINIYEKYESNNSLFLITEYCKGNDLISYRTLNNKIIPEKEIFTIFIQIISAINYCHNNNICCMNINPENILFVYKDLKENNYIKLINFETSQIIQNQKLKMKVVPSYFLAPEVLSGEFGLKSDIWSAGLLLYFLLSGEMPFKKTVDSNLYENIIQIKYSFPNNKWKNISKEAKDLVKRMLLPEGQRMNINQMLSHSWCQKNKISFGDLSFNISIFNKYKYSILFKKMILTYISSRINIIEINSIIKLFNIFDINKNGQITLNDFKKSIKKFYKNIDDNHKEKNDNIENEINYIFHAIDTDKNGKIEFTEFLASLLPEKLYTNKYCLYESFSFFSQNKYNISKKDLYTLLKIDFHKNKEIHNIFQLADKNRDGIIDFNEFTELMGIKNDFIKSESNEK